MSAFLSGEMKDTVELHPMGVYGTDNRRIERISSLTQNPVLEQFFSRTEHAKLFRSWAGSASMWIKVSDVSSPLDRSLSNDQLVGWKHYLG